MLVMVCYNWYLSVKQHQQQNENKEEQDEEHICHFASMYVFYERISTEDNNDTYLKSSIQLHL